MPYTGTVIVLNRQMMEEIERDFQRAARKTFPNATLQVRDSEGSEMLVTDVLRPTIVNGETALASQGAEVAAEFSRLLQQELNPFKG